MTKTVSKHNPVPGFEGIAYQGVSRRAFLLSTTGAAIGIAFGSSLSMTRAFAQGAGVTPNAWMRVAADGTVTIMSPASEMGQGVKTAMPLLVAEEMDLDWSKVKVEQAPYIPKAYGNPLFGGGMTTGASRTTRGYYDIMRLAGLQAKLIMMGAAAQKWGVPVSEVTTEPHVVVHKSSGRRMGYGEVASFAQVPAEPPKVSKEMLKPMRQQRLIGKDVPRVDVPDKVVGRAEYGIDVRMAGILYGTVMRAPVQGEKPEKIDDAEAKKVPGVVKIVPMPYGVGVVAETYHAARKARAVLKVEWTKAAKARGYNSGQMLAAYSVRGRNLADGGVEFLKHNDAKAAIAGAAKTVTAEYTSEHVAHACMEPMNATALVEGDKIEVWAPSQSGFVMNLALMLGLKYKPENIKTNITLLGGGFGRRVEADYVVDAAILAKAVEGNPVKVIWTREDDIRNDKYRPLTAQHLSAGLDAQGNIVGFRHRIVAESIYARAAPPVFQQAGGKDQPVCEGSEINYAIPNHLVEYLREQRGVDVGFWRAVGPGYTKFAIETFIDEMAAAAGKDPIEYRASLWAKQPRARAVMEEVARMADWKRKRPGGRALGIAYSDAWGAHCAQVAEVSVNRKTGKIRVHEVWCAVDPGVALQPKNIEAQIESAVMYGASHALLERITFSGGEVKQSNFHDYPIMRMNEAPKVTTKVMATDNPPSGMGEVGLPPVGAAIANAVAVITGKRLRSLPLDASLLKA
jgi:isoquinoline 1-oxidoreductase beta subunit